MENEHKDELVQVMEALDEVHPVTVVVGACLLFLAVRLLMILSSMDKICHLNIAEYRLYTQALHFLHTGSFLSPILDFRHLWGWFLMPFFMMPFVVVGFSAFQTLIITPFMISFLGFTCLIGMLAKYCGRITAVMGALLLIFPDPQYLRWSLTTWGGHPEAAGLILIVLLAWVTALNLRTSKALYLAGLSMGLILSFSGAALIPVLPMAALTPFLIRGGRRIRRTLQVWLGALIGVAPLIVWMLCDGLWGKYRLDTMTDEGVNITGFVGPPSVGRIHEFMSRLEMNGFFGNSIWFYLLAGALIYLAVMGLLDKSRRWYLFFPVSVLSTLLLMSTCTLVEHVHVYHVLWLFPISYAAMAIALGEGFKKFLAHAPKIIRVCEVIPRAALFVFLLILGIVSCIPLMNPYRIGHAFSYRGDEYNNLGLKKVFYREASAVNCFLDRSPSIFESLESINQPIPFYRRLGFRQGMATCYPDDNYITIAYEPKTVYADDISFESVPTDWASGFSCGIGCGIALKPDMERKELYRLPQGDIRKIASECYQRCANLPCLKK